MVWVLVLWRWLRALFDGLFKAAQHRAHSDAGARSEEVADLGHKSARLDRDGPAHFAAFGGGFEFEVRPCFEQARHACALAHETCASAGNPAYALLFDLTAVARMDTTCGAHCDGFRRRPFDALDGWQPFWPLVCIAQGSEHFFWRRVDLGFCNDTKWCCLIETHTEFDEFVPRGHVRLWSDGMNGNWVGLTLSISAVFRNVFYCEPAEGQRDTDGRTCAWVAGTCGARHGVSCGVEAFDGASVCAQHLRVCVGLWTAFGADASAVDVHCVERRLLKHAQVRVFGVSGTAVEALEGSFAAVEVFVFALGDKAVKALDFLLEACGVDGAFFCEFREAIGLGDIVWDGASVDRGDQDVFF